MGKSSTFPRSKSERIHRFTLDWASFSSRPYRIRCLKAWAMIFFAIMINRTFHLAGQLILLSWFIRSHLQSCKQASPAPPAWVIYKRTVGEEVLKSRNSSLYQSIRHVTMVMTRRYMLLTNTVDNDSISLSGVRMSNITQNIVDGHTVRVCGTHTAVILLLFFFFFFFFTVKRRQAPRSVPAWLPPRHSA